MPNALIYETSPYLLQHAYNPVDWQPWKERALQKAKDESKLIIVSIGYSACHWCHVMEHESFSDEEVARFMNKNFVCIKIDREERPDIDHVYMTAVQLITGSGGWPLNVITLPNTKPIYGGTYFPKKTWLTMLEQILNFVKMNPEKAQEQADSLTQHIQIDSTFNFPSENQEFSLDDLASVLEIWLKRIDIREGGYLRAPKFPLPSGFHFLLQFHSFTKASSLGDMALSSVAITLDKMANGGIYDHVGGGFSRYSTDSFWKVPHFEKMLYDNAQLVSLYAHTFQLTRNPLYRTVIEETLAFIERELTDMQGGFYCALDADSEGEEGKFYVWSIDDFHQALGVDAPLFIEYFNIKKEGNWEHNKNILFKTRQNSYFLEAYQFSENDFNTRLSTFKTVMLRERDLRVRPSLDDKILTSWNALAVKAYVDASRSLNRADYLETAINQATFILKNVKHEDDRLSRSFKHGEQAKINGFLDDYAFTIEALIHLYQATFNFVWLQEAERLMEYALSHFYDSKTGMFFYTSDIDAPLIARSIEVMDNVLPSSNSVIAKNLFILGMYFEREYYLETAKSMLRKVQDMAKKGAEYYGNWDMLWAWFASEPNMVAIVGEQCVEMRQAFDEHFLPNVFYLGEIEPRETLPLLKNRFVSNQTLIYVCKNKTCLLPSSNVNEAIKHLV